MSHPYALLLDVHHQSSQLAYSASGAHASCHVSRLHHPSRLLGKSVVLLFRAIGTESELSQRPKPQIRHTHTLSQIERDEAQSFVKCLRSQSADNLLHLFHGRLTSCSMISIHSLELTQSRVTSNKDECGRE